MIQDQFIDSVYYGDIMALLSNLPSKSIDMILGDPDYNVGIKYGNKSYTRDFDEYIAWYIELAKESLRVLKTTGNMFLINYPKQNSYLRVKYLDLACYDVHDYAWVYNTNVGHSNNRFTTAHRSILHCRLSSNNQFYKDQVAQPYLNPEDRRIKQNIKNGSKGRMPYDWLNYNLVKNVSSEKTIHACQIPQKLTELLINASTKPGDVVLVLFGGSGSEVALCQQMDRHFITAEIDEKYHRIIVDRLERGKIDPKYRLINSMKSSRQTKEPLPLSF